MISVKLYYLLFVVRQMHSKAYAIAYLVMQTTVNELNNLPMTLYCVSSSATVASTLPITALITEHPSGCPAIALTFVAVVVMVAERLSGHPTQCHSMLSSCTMKLSARIVRA
ncbi:uncharacterized protein LOC110434871 [Sorghum bicolor]|uniref:uncharacterized protein LOC110434871 n=1 Tax=Sorghum bicolor TaxID=4558 RepID=UPI000B425B20|nr:uncharacterized protein LOC110434871 [Sorghum bicolor]|eukprot:XP_021315344.1 uncharacterized protein LOC110434871 [Sorghum bicolor]